MRMIVAMGCFLVCRVALGQSLYPSNWWVGMKHSTIQVIVRGDGVGKATGVTVNYPGVTLTDWHRASSPDYVFLHLRIEAAAKPGMVTIGLTGRGSVTLPLEQRRPGNGTAYAQGITSSDFIYFLMPDRWSNGDRGNDRIPGLRDQSLNRDSMYLRHGGDFQGIIDHLDYLQQLGVTALWMTPVILNDMPDRTEHGYAFTDHYIIDPRLGGAKMYAKLSDELHRRGMKLIQDAVYNHVGSYHWIIADPPEKNWLHQWPTYTQTNYRGEPLMDPHASAGDRKLSSDGWFTRQMPDLNQDNPDLAEFLIQHAIWSVESFGVDGWRIDTYMYNSLPFMNRCNQALTDEYPKLTMFGECWTAGVARQAWFTRNNLNTSFKSNLTGVLDFQCLFSGIAPAVKDTSSWGAGVNQLYQTLGEDFLYQHPANNVIFLDNHDMSRFFSQTGEDAAAQKIGLEWLLTERGIPQLYYGTEVLMAGISNPDGLVRSDFPGGWKGDSRSAFTGEGLTADQRVTQELVKRLGSFRLRSSALRTGTMMQYVPQGSLYVYFRYDAKQTILCAMNTGNATVTVDFRRFRERTKGFSQGVDVVTGEKYPLAQPATLPGRTMWVLELQ
ncbi:MAG TPA: alpha-amylase family glycosyl hydrolase [Puia sp.]|uniref:alpha-amylase family glycosyl hydrolase n=1 Tax=Puia sp. TaxID=2045100 RepID=UPI002CCEC16B|nr:alpha-amylase family glycosyl hydrolase [Puia sp.]HVU96217.1 alpha-amylase family glycosyl hydrolase [Puia sp.]